MTDDVDQQVILRFTEELDRRAAPVPLAAEVPTIPVPLKQSRPTYDEAIDGNRFAWILKAAKQVRIQEQAANEVRRIRLQAARRCAMPILVAPSTKESSC